MRTTIPEALAGRMTTAEAMRRMLPDATAARDEARAALNMARIVLSQNYRDMDAAIVEFWRSEGADRAHWRHNARACIAGWKRQTQRVSDLHAEVTRAERHLASLVDIVNKPTPARAAIPETRTLSRDINALQGRLRQLQGMQAELAPGVVVMGPGSHGRDALDALGARDALGNVIGIYERAIGSLADAHTEADISETARRMFTTHGTERADCRRYLRDLIEEYRATVGTRRAAEPVEWSAAA